MIILWGNIYNKDTMSTTLIEDAPKELGTKISYNDYFVIPRERLRNPKKLSDLFYDSANDSYGPFEWEEAINFLQLLDNESSL